VFAGSDYTRRTYNGGTSDHREYTLRTGLYTLFDNGTYLNALVMKRRNLYDRAGIAADGQRRSDRQTVWLAAAGFSPAEADSLRQAMGAKRSIERMDALRDKLIAGMRSRGIDAPTAETIYSKLRSFAEFGFPESHAFSFAYLVYASAWLKARKPEDFYAGVLAAQPMGFRPPRAYKRPFVPM